MKRLNYNQMIKSHGKIQFMILNKTAANHSVEILSLEDSFINISEPGWVNH